MSIRVMNLVMDSTLEGASRRWLLTALADRADDAGYCWPGVPNLVRKTGLSRATVFRLLGEFEAESLIQRRPWFKPSGAQDTNRYRINLETLRALRHKDAEDQGGHELEDLFDGPAGGATPSHGETPTPPSRGETPRGRKVRPGGSHGETGGGRTTRPNTSVDPSGDSSVGGGPTANAQPPSESPPATPPRSVDLDDRTTWQCRKHLALPAPEPGVYRESCPPCGEVRVWAQAQLAARADAAEADAAAVAAACTWHDERGQVVDPSTGAPFAPVWVCDHTVPPAVVADRLRDRAQALAHRPRATTGPAAARELFRPTSRHRAAKAGIPAETVTG